MQRRCVVIWILKNISGNTCGGAMEYKTIGDRSIVYVPNDNNIDYYAIMCKKLAYRIMHVNEERLILKMDKKPR